MDNYLEQAFEISFLKIGIIANSGVLQIGVGAGIKPRVPLAGYTTIGESTVKLSQPPAVPLQPSGRNTMDLKL